MAHSTYLDGVAGKVSATTVHIDVEKALKNEAKKRGVSISTVLREALYEFADRHLGVSADLPAITNYVQK
ncbi:CopG family transcriptional regulator [Streptomyces sp. SPB4]|uniref:ribbon-helix-helix domain-containing protein n=1 Tax=Streptomyces sp. SPB4 TaxID=2940553 RepID=UPI002476C9C0|nr:CopG family transcriptional regulator [Streptomyces sp. SPB4]MDH6537797.1 post-segregation antitoxin (ccd killing protein) [Streptomyces sp. SPB4]